MAGRILIIRGGAIGDFILTLPALRLLRENFSTARIELLGYPAIAALALDEQHCDAVHSIEYGPLAGFFSRKPSLDPQMSAFFADFDQIISYLYDPDGIFAANLRTAGVKNLLCGPGRLGDQSHASSQLAQPLEQLALYLDDPAARFFPNRSDQAAAQAFLANHPAAFVAIHPGSGSQQKNWPLNNWREIIRRLLAGGREILIVGGEADETALNGLEEEFALVAARHLPLRTLGAILARAELFLGHDSGISHLAAAAGARCLLFFGPTDPDIWAPLNPAVQILPSPTGFIGNLEVESVWSRITAAFSSPVPGEKSGI